MQNNNALDILLRAYIGERDAFYNDVTDLEGNCDDKDDVAELARMYKIIDDAQAALARIKLTDALPQPKIAAGGNEQC